MKKQLLLSAFLLLNMKVGQATDQDPYEIPKNMTTKPQIVFESDLPFDQSVAAVKEAKVVDKSEALNSLIDDILSHILSFSTQNLENRLINKKFHRLVQLNFEDRFVISLLTEQQIEDYLFHKDQFDPPLRRLNPKSLRFNQYMTPFNLKQIDDDNPQIKRVETILDAQISSHKLLSNAYRVVEEDGKVCKHFTYRPNKISPFRIGNHDTYQQNKDYYAPLIKEVISAISSLKQLEILDFSKFYLGTGVFGVETLSSLPWFGIDFLEAVARLPLKTLKLNHLSDVFKTDLTPFFQKNSHLQTLEFFQLDNHKYKIDIPSLPDLVSLSLHRMTIGKPQVLSIFKCTSLKSLQLPACTFIVMRGHNPDQNNLFAHPSLEKIDFATTIEAEGEQFFRYAGQGLKGNQVLKTLLFPKDLDKFPATKEFLDLIKHQNPELTVSFNGKKEE